MSQTAFTPATLVPSLEKRIRELEAHLAALEAVREAVKPLGEWLRWDGKVFEMSKSPCVHRRNVLIEQFTDLMVALDDALAAAEEDDVAGT